MLKHRLSRGHAGKRVLLPGIGLTSTVDSQLSFELTRVQYPLRLGFSMTVRHRASRFHVLESVWLKRSSVMVCSRALRYRVQQTRRKLRFCCQKGVTISCAGMLYITRCFGRNSRQS